MGVVINIIGSIIAGGIIGMIARAILPGKQDLSIPITVGLGIVGMVLGNIVGQILPFDNTGVPWIMGIVMAVAVLFGVSKSGMMSKISK